MKNQLKPLLIIGGVAVVAIIAIITFSLMNMGNMGQGKTEMTMSGTTSDNSASSSKNAVSTNEITIQYFEFQPKTIKVKAGTTVTWTNQDSVEHTATSIEGAPVAFDSGLLAKGESFSYTFDKAGTYNYLCTPHTSMKGTVIVTE